MSDQSDFNSFVCSNYWHKATLIACRFTDLGCKDWERLSCEWHVRYNFGAKQDPDDKYFEGNTQRRRSVDALIEKPEVSAQAEIMAQTWAFEKKRLADTRGAPPPVIVLPPEPTPQPLPEPKPLPPIPDVPKQKPVWLIKASVYLTILTPIVLLATSFLPPPFSSIAKVVWELLKQLANN